MSGDEFNAALLAKLEAQGENIQTIKLDIAELRGGLTVRCKPLPIRQGEVSPVFAVGQNRAGEFLRQAEELVETGQRLGAQAGNASPAGQGPVADRVSHLDTEVFGQDEAVELVVLANGVNKRSGPKMEVD